MASGVVQALQDCNKPISGWVNVPEDCVRSVPSITLHGACPAGINEPTRAGVTGTNEIIRILQSAQPDDLCICLISGGGSALLPSPIEGISLQDKQTITRQLSAAGANIAELNAVRKKLSRVKGGWVSTILHTIPSFHSYHFLMYWETPWTSLHRAPQCQTREG